MADSYVGDFVSQEFYVFHAVFLEVLRMIGETIIFHRKLTNMYCGDLRRRRIRAQIAQKNAQILAREIPYPEAPPSVATLIRQGH